MGSERRHLLMLLTGAVAYDVEVLRRRWDPVMAARIPAHVSLVYPEETVDERLVLERMAVAATQVAPFAVSLGRVETDRMGHGGVWFTVQDPAGSWQSLRDRILAPPFAPVSVSPHVSVVHPRTSQQGPAAAADLDQVRIDGESMIDEVLYTTTSSDGMRILERFALTGSAPLRVVAGLVRRNGRVLLFHRRADRSSYPNVWDLPGGHIDDGESMADALRREMSEELGIGVDPPESPWQTMRLPGIEMDVVLIDDWTGEPTNTAPDEHDDLRWVDVAEASHLDLAHPSYLAMLQRALEPTPGVAP